MTLRSWAPEQMLNQVYSVSIWIYNLRAEIQTTVLPAQRQCYVDLSMAGNNTSWKAAQMNMK